MLEQPDIKPGAKAAVIGAGVAGLTAAYLLQKKFDVTLFERNGYLGGHSNTIVIPEGPDRGTPVDTGFIVFNDRNYPAFTHLLNQLGISGQASDMSFGFSSREDRMAYSSDVPGGLCADMRNLVSPRFYGMISDILRFNAKARGDLKSGAMGGRTLGEYLEEGRYGRAFKDFYLLPMGAAIWSTPLHEMLAFPAETFARFFENHGLLELKGRPHWMTVPGGSHTYVKALRARLQGRVETKSEIGSVRREQAGVRIRQAGGKERRFDFVVMAAHADESLRMLEDPSAEESRLLGAWTYTRNRTVLHTDESVMPCNKRAWASWNYVLESGLSKDAPVSLTYYMNRLQNLRTVNPYFVTLNRQAAIPKDKVIAEMIYAHPCYNAAALASQPELPRLNGARRTYYCGSYFGYGFHEDAVKSAAESLRSLGVEL